MPTTLHAQYRRAFKDADIRGLYPKEIDEELAYFVARAFVEEFGYQQIVVGCDMRLSTPALREAFVKGATDSGAAVVDIGLVTSPMLYFASATMDLPGVMITASHSPKQYNGLKLVHAQAIPLTERQGLRAVRKRMEQMRFAESAQRGKVSRKDVRKAYQRFVTKGVKRSRLTGITVAADAGNGMASVLLPLLQEKLPVRFDVLFGTLDGTFPNRGSDPTLSKHQRPLKQRLKAKRYDFGIAYDGDADRIAFLDEKGAYINSAVIGALIAERMLQTHPQERIGTTILTSRAYEEAITRAGGKPTLMKVGHAFIKQAMRQKDVRFACEHSGHFYFKDYFYTDSVTLTLLAVLEVYAEAKAAGQTFSEMMRPYCMYQQTEDVIVPVKDRALALRLTEEYLETLEPQRIKRFDGLIVDLGNVWGAVKPSVTEFALKVMFESENRHDARATQQLVVDFIKTVADRE